MNFSIRFSLQKVAIAAASLAAASPVFSQAPIVDLSGGSSQQSASSYPDSTYTEPAYQETQIARAPVSSQRAQANPQAEAYYQMQVLQQEVQELRGAVEELRHEVKRLKQQRTEDYMDLDRRIARLSGTEPAKQPPAGSGADNGNGADTGAGAGAQRPPAGKPAPASADERDRYQASFGLARNGDYNGASAEFKRLLQDYPNGQYAPNANYWLGEIALVQGNLEEARQWFVALLDGYPNSTKVWDGRYKLGTVYHQLGDQQKARELLEQVAASDARAAGLAKQYLEQNFQ
ncbi:tol-pal system protein YbgF [Microbulbifer marinus]|uniref:Cell division coordinator CpoB n=1 Tax=Microbulbifer marinus TaxID=658218 RepID=A0A1H4AIZ7_9GAMM|nr:tol-pal system protein YbgF [Microbulbifer marinus]SEA35875.1 tol-pal system protein YbgF [Microbulbifer marinus]